MASVSGVSRRSRRHRVAGRTEADREPSRSTVREVCLIGLDCRSPTNEWAAGVEVSWLGRTYRVRAAVDDDGPRERRYVHLAPAEGD